MIHIDRCVCYQKTFDALKQVAKETESTSVHMLQEHTDFGKNCRLCIPYVRQMLKTGETVFFEIMDR